MVLGGSLGELDNRRRPGASEHPSQLHQLLDPDVQGLGSGGAGRDLLEERVALLEHPRVLECAVVGAPDEARGTIVKAFVVLRPATGSAQQPDAGADGGPALVSELQDFVKARIAPYKYPRAIEFVPELPKTRSGKIRRVELRQAELRKKGATAASGFM